MPKRLAVHLKGHFNLMVRCASASLAAGVLYLLTQAFDCHILPATDFNSAGSRQTAVTIMEPFSQIVHCAPFNVMISPDTQYKVAVEAEDGVKAAVSPVVRGDKLHLEVKQGFRTDKPIKIVVGLPKDKLQSVHNKAPQSDIAVSEGFSAQKFNVRNSGAGHLHLKGLNAQEASISNDGVGHIVWKGNIRSLSIKGTGVSKVYVQGSLGAVAVQLTGVSEAHLGSTSDDMVINGNVDMLSKVLYSGGRCEIGQSGPRMTGIGAMGAGGIGAFAGNMHFGNMAGGMGNMFGNACQQVNRIQVPDLDLKWSCGMQVEGRFTCAGMPSGSSASASSSGNGQSFSSTTGNGGVAMSSSSGGDGTSGRQSFYSTSEGSVRSMSCAASASELRMYP